jgi:hypothetical protein
MQTLVSGRAKFSYDEAERNKSGWMAKFQRANRIAFGVPKKPWLNNASSVPPVPVDAGVAWLLAATVAISTSARDAMQLAFSTSNKTNVYEFVDSYRTMYIETTAFIQAVSEIQQRLARTNATIEAYATSSTTLVAPSETKVLNDELTDLGRSLDETRSRGRALVDRLWKVVREPPLASKWDGIVVVRPSESQGTSSSVDVDGFTLLDSGLQGTTLSTSSSENDMGREDVTMPPPAPRGGKDSSRDATPKRRNMTRR